MNWNAFFVITTFALCGGLLLYLPFFIWFRWDNARKRRHREPPSIHVTPAGILLYALMLIILFSGLAVGQISPESWFGSLVRTLFGGFGFASIVISMTTIVEGVLTKKGLVFHYQSGLQPHQTDQFASYRERGMNGYTLIRSLRICGAPVHLHWSSPAIGLGLFVISINTPLLALETFFAYISIIIIHEAGHAFAAKRLGYQPRDIYIGFFHGLCIYDQPRTYKEDCQIAWGGALAQLLVALPLVLLAIAIDGHKSLFFDALTTTLGYLSIQIAFINLLPLSGLDGEKAWQLLPIWYSEYRSNKRARK